MALDPTARVRQKVNQASCGLDGEVVILNLDNSLYYGTDRVGACIWNALQQPAQVDDICRIVMSRFGVAEERCRADVLSFLNRLMSAGLLEVVS